MKLFSLIAALSLGSSLAWAEGAAPMADGVITKIDTRWNKLTIDHGPLESLDMPAMKMVFAVADPAMLEGLTEGVKIRFAVDRLNGKLTVTEIEKE